MSRANICENNSKWSSKLTIFCGCLQLLLHVISFAFLMVLASTFIMVPVLLYMFKLNKQGWEWQHAALFAATLASTDAVAVGAILKAGKFLVFAKN